MAFADAAEKDYSRAIRVMGAKWAVEMKTKYVTVAQRSL